MNNTHEKMNEYLDFYESLLTEKQQSIMDDYYRNDYSLSELSENLKITRSAVSDNIKRASQSLIKYEEKLKLVEKYHNRLHLYEQLDKMDDTLVKQISATLKESEL